MQYNTNCAKFNEPVMNWFAHAGKIQCDWSVVWWEATTPTILQTLAVSCDVSSALVLCVLVKRMLPSWVSGFQICI